MTIEFLACLRNRMLMEAIQRDGESEDLSEITLTVRDTRLKGSRGVGLIFQRMCSLRVIEQNTTKF